MAQILVQVPADMLKRLERVAPARSRKRSRFIRLALQRALMDLQDLETREAYRREPDDAQDWFDPSVWDEWRPRRPGKARRPRKR
jgi:hypothetical protein